MWTAFKALGIGAKLLVLGAIIALFAATYYVGLNNGTNISKVEIAQYEGKVADLNRRLIISQGKVDVKVVTEYVERVAYVDRVVYKNRDVVRTVVPEQFAFSKGWVYAYNQSVLGLPIDPILASNETASTTSDMRALADTIVPNNGICLATAEQLKSLQQLIKEREAAREEVTR